MTYEQGILHMKEKCNNLNAGEKASFVIGQLIIDYPGYKKNGDYRVSKEGKAPKHTDIVQFLYKYTNEENYIELIQALNDLYTNGLSSTNSFFTQSFKETLFWITLQEEINYPQPRFAGRKLPYQRFYEGVLAKLGFITLEEVLKRTNNHGGTRPTLLSIDKRPIPVFYK